MPKFSFVIPLYNAEATIDRCLKSILRLEYTDYEIILINDGSTDNSLKICEDYSRKHENILTVDKENGGQGAARNTGIDNAKGEYILFCDVDDYYDSINLERVMNCIIKQKDDDILLCFGFRNVWDGIPEEKGKYCPRVFQQLEEHERVFAISSRELHEVSGYTVWNKVYSKELIERYSIRFPERKKTGNADDWSEDLAFNIQYYLHVREIRMLNLDAYFLSKHGSAVEQSEEHLANRIGHMMNVLESVYKSEAIQVSNEYKNMFWQTGVWHLQRYIYLTLRYYGPKELRRVIHHAPYRSLLTTWIECALREWTTMSQRWTPNINEEYHIILKYLLSGKYWKYKLETAFLWKIKNRFKNYK